MKQRASSLCSSAIHVEFDGILGDASKNIELFIARL
jgi:hypothetical protein